MRDVRHGRQVRRMWPRLRQMLDTFAFRHYSPPLMIYMATFPATKANTSNWWWWYCVRTEGDPAV